MKNQYFGDVNDYLKYGLLRVIGQEAGLRLAVCWMLTADDGRPDGVLDLHTFRPTDVKDLVPTYLKQYHVV